MLRLMPDEAWVCGVNNEFRRMMFCCVYLDL